MIAPAGGRIVYAAPFRRYGDVVIIDHGRGWTSVITDLATLERRARAQTSAAARRSAAPARGSPRVTVELRRNGRPVPFAQLIGG